MSKKQIAHVTQLAIPTVSQPLTAEDITRLSIDELHSFINELQSRQIALEAENQQLRRNQQILQDNDVHLLQTILDNTSSVAYAKDLDERYLFINRRYEELFHCQAKQVKGKTDYDIFPKRFAEILQINDQKVIHSRSALEYEEIVPQDDGLHTYISNKFPLYDVQGNLYAICGISTDITQRKWTEQVLRESQRRYENIFNHIATPILENDFSKVLLAMKKLRSQGVNDLWDYLQENPTVISEWVQLIRVTNVNSATLQLFAAKSKKEFLEGNIDRFFTPLAFTAFTEGICAIWQGKETFTTEMPLRTLDGREIVVALFLPILPMEQANYYVPLSLIDITERKQTEWALRDNQIRLAEAQRLAHLGYWEWNLTTGIEKWSEEMYTILGLTPGISPITHEIFENALHPQDRDFVLDAFEQAIFNQQPYELEFRIIKPDKTVCYVQACGGLIRDLHHVLRLLGTVQNITERKLIEESFKKSEMQLSEAQRIGQLGYWEYDLRTDTVHWSEETYRIFGLPSHQKNLNLEMVTQLIHPQDYSWVVFTKTLVNSESYGIDYRIVCLDKTIRYVHDRLGKIVRNEQGDIVYLMGTVQDITERKLMEESLRKTQMQLIEAQRIAHVGYWENDLLTGESFWSEEVFRILGLPHSEKKVSVDTFLKFVHPEDFNRMQDTIEQAIHNNLSCNIEVRVLCADGKVRYLHVLGQVVHDAIGKPIRFTGTTQDITERKRIEASLRKSQMQLAEAQHISHIGSWEYNTKTKTVEWSDEVFHIIGVTPDEGNPSFQNFSKLIHSDDYNKVQEKVITIIEEGKPIQEGKPYDIEFRIVRPDKEIRYVHSLAKPIYNPYGKPFRFTGTIQDVTQRKLAEKALQRSERRYATLTQISPVGIFELDETNTFTYLNEQACKILGCTPQDIIQRHWSDTVRVAHPYLHNEFDQPTPMPLYGEYQFYRYRKMDGEQHPTYSQRLPSTDSDTDSVWVIVQTVPIYNDNKELKGYVGTLTDITQRKLIEEQLREAEEKYHSLVEQMPAVTYIADLSRGGELVYVSPQIESLVGMSATQWLAKPRFWFQLVHDDDCTRVSQEYEKALTASNPYSFEYRICTYNKEIIWVHDRVFIKRDREGNPYLFQGIIVDITERKQIEQALRQSEERFELAVRGANDGIWDWNLETNHVYRSQHLKQMLGFAPNELNGGPKEWSDLIHPEDIAQVFETEQDYFEKKIPTFEITYRVRHQRGDYLWVLMRGVAVWNEQGKPYRMVGTTTDVTAHRQILDALRESEERFNLAVQGAKDGIWDWNIISGDMYFSPRFAEMLGLSPEECGNRLEDCVKRIHPDDSLRIKNSFKVYFQRKTNVFEDTYRLQHQNKDYVWMLVRGMAVWNEWNRAYRMVGTITDMTLQKQVETALRESEQYRRTLIEEALSGLVLFSMDGFIKEANPAFAMIIGYAVDELVDKVKHRDLTPLQYLEIDAKQADELLNVGRCGPYEKALIHKQGYLVPVKLSGVLVKHYDKSSVWFNIEDITEQKQIESRLNQAKDAAEMANRAKTTFLAHMSHELRTPLNSILGFTQILNRDNTLSLQQKEHVATIQRSGEYLLMLITDILDLSKIEAGHLELSPNTFVLTNFLKELAELFEMRAKQKGIDFVYEIVEASRANSLPLLVYADEKRLRQILLNLLSNAIKFTEYGQVRLKVHCHHGKVRFQVEDTGVGIAPEELNRIFLPFQQVGNHLYHAQGTGLGLSISRKLTEAMGGTLQVKSKPGVGSIFWLDLKLREVSSKEFLQVLPHNIEPTIIGYQVPDTLIERKSFRILVVDDKSENRSILTNLLTSLGFEVKEAQNGQETVEIASTWRPDVILMDLIMPVMDGFVATRHLRNIPELNQMIIIAVSASAFSDHLKKSQEVGCNDFISKPFNLKLLLNILQKHLRLTWLYEQPVVTTSTRVLHNVDFPNLPVQQTDLLFDLVMKGYIKGILEYALQLEQSNPEYSDFAHYLIQLAKEFRIQELRNIAQHYRKLLGE